MKQKRNFYLALPILVLPFITVLFWALGGGQGSTAQASAIASAGINPDLPVAQFNDNASTWDKLSIYQRAIHDSLAADEARKNDPYLRFSTLTELQEKQKLKEAEENMINASLGKKEELMKTDELQIQERIGQLYNVINQPQARVTASAPTSEPAMKSPELTTDVDRLEKLMESMNEGRQDNPELKQMDNVLDKILDIQHPERVQGKIQELKSERKKNTFKVSPLDRNAMITVLDTMAASPETQSREEHISVGQEVSTNDFFEWSDDSTSGQAEGNAIEAVVHDTQTLVTGSVIKLRLSNEIEINNTMIPANAFVYGIASINGERLSIAISSIRYNTTVLPVTLKVYDLDGMEGIYIPGAIERDAAKQATGESLDQMQLTNSMNTSLGVQAASAGIEAAKGLFSKKVKLVKVSVKAGYQILLYDASTSK